MYDAVKLINPDYFTEVMDSAIENVNGNISLVLNYFARYGEKACAYSLAAQPRQTVTTLYRQNTPRQTT